MTAEERHLWYDYFKKMNISARRQYVIENYIVDFYIPSAKLAVELDGSQHYEEDMQVKDAVRTSVIEQYGITVVRFPNNIVNRRFNDLCIYLTELIANK